MSRREFVRNTAAAMAAVSAGSFSAAYAEDKAKDAWKMKLAASSVMFGKLPFEQVCETLARLGLQGLDPQRIGIAFAPYHLQAYKTPIEDVIRIAGSQCLFFYAWQHGNDRTQMPGVGPVDFTPWLRALDETDYAHYSSIFMHGHPAADEMEAAVSKSRKYLVDCREKV